MWAGPFGVEPRTRSAYSMFASSDTVFALSSGHGKCGELIYKQYCFYVSTNVLCNWAGFGVPAPPIRENAAPCPLQAWQ